MRYATAIVASIMLCAACTSDTTDGGESSVDRRDAGGDAEYDPRKRGPSCQAAFFDTCTRGEESKGSADAGGDVWRPRLSEEDVERLQDCRALYDREESATRRELADRHNRDGVPAYCRHINCPERPEHICAFEPEPGRPECWWRVASHPKFRQKFSICDCSFTAEDVDTEQCRAQP